MLEELNDILDGVYKLNDLTPKVHDRILSFGELISTSIISSVLSAEYLDSREVIVTDESHGDANVNFDVTTKNINKAFEGFTGFMCCTWIYC